MKKQLKIFALLVLSLSVLLCGCGQKSLGSNVTAQQITDIAIDAVGAVPQSSTAYQKDNPMDSYAMSLWADGLYGECAEYSLLEDYSIFYSADNTTYEISVLKAKTSDDVSKLKSVLERRKNTLSEGDKAAYDPDFKSLMSASRIESYGNFVVLLITPDNDAAIKAIEGLKE